MLKENTQTVTVHSSRILQLEPIHLIQKRILRLINCMSPRESTEELFTSDQIPNIYEIYIDELIKFCLNVARKEGKLSEIFVGNNNDTRGSSLGFYLVPSIRNQVQNSSLTFSGTTLLNELISCGDLPVDFKRSGANEHKKILRKMKSRINYKDVIIIFTRLYLS